MQNSNDLKATRRTFGNMSVVNYDVQKFSKNGRALFRINPKLIDMEVEAVELKIGTQGSVVGDVRIYLEEEQTSYSFPRDLFRALFVPIVDMEKVGEEDKKDDE